MPKKKSTTPVKQSTDRATQYAIDIVEKRVVAGPFVRGACQRHLNDLEHAWERGLFYDPRVAEHDIDFFEEILCLNGDEYEGKKFLLLSWEDFIVGSLGGWRKIPENISKVNLETIKSNMLRLIDGSQVKDIIIDNANRRFNLAYIETAKGPLALDTPIATTTGWTTMGDIKIGDYVFDDQGKPTKVIAVSPIFYNRECFKVCFSDGEEIVADAEHRWPTRSYREKGRIRLKTTKEISESIVAWEGVKNKAKNHHIYLAPPLDTDEVELLIPPYVLGVWLADGDTAGARITINSADTEILEYLTADGIEFNCKKHPVANSIRIYLTDGNGRKSVIGKIFSVDNKILSNFSFSELSIASGCSIDNMASFIKNSGMFEMISPRTNIGYSGGTISSRWRIIEGVVGNDNVKDYSTSMLFKLRSLKEIGNKHIPVQYMRSSIEQRLSLLRGILDSDGSVAIGGKCEVTFCNNRLASDVRELLISLGFKCTIKERAAKINGREVGRRWRIGFQGYSTFSPFRLKRKVNRLLLPPLKSQRCQSRVIESCEKVNSVPVRCITVDAESHLFLAGKSLIKLANSGKSPLAAGLGIKGLVADGVNRAELYASATMMDQAMILFRDVIAFYDQSPELQSRLKTSGAGEFRWNLSYPATSSFFRVISSEKSKSGYRVYMYIADEVHECKDGGALIGLLRKGFKRQPSPLGIEITNSGSDVSSFCFERHEMARKISMGAMENDSIFAYVCALDEEDIKNEHGEESESFLYNEKCWVKVNPSIDYGLPGYQYIRDQIKEAEGMPSQMATVKRLNFCQWVAADNPWLSGELWFGCQQSGGIPESILTGRKCWGGLDLSSTQDLTAFALLFEPGYVEQEFIEMEKGKGGLWQPCERKFDPFWRLKCWFWIPGDNLLAKENIDHVPYTVWRDKGFLTALPGRAINKSSVVKLIHDVSSKFDLQGVAFDRAKIKDMDEFAEKAGIELTFGSWNREKRQWDWEPGDGIRMMPFGQESRSMDPAISKFEGMLASKGEIVENNPALLHDGNPVLTWCAANAVTIEDEDKNRKLSKKKSTGRIDGIISSVMACGVAENSDGGKSEFDGKSVEEIRKMLRGED